MLVPLNIHFLFPFIVSPLIVLFPLLLNWCDAFMIVLSINCLKTAKKGFFFYSNENIIQMAKQQLCHWLPNLRYCCYAVFNIKMIFLTVKKMMKIILKPGHLWKTRSVINQLLSLLPAEILLLHHPAEPQKQKGYSVSFSLWCVTAAARECSNSQVGFA